MVSRSACATDLDCSVAACQALISAQVTSWAEYQWWAISMCGPMGRHQAAVGVDGLGEPRVQPAVLARQQVIVHGLADQRVPEHEVPPSVDQDVRGHGGAQAPGSAGPGPGR